MKRFEYLFVIVIIVVSISVKSWQQDIVEDEAVISENHESPTKILVDPNTNAINFVKPPRVKPTTEQTEFINGLPPGSTNSPSRPTRPTRATRPTRTPKPPRPQRPSRPTKLTSGSQSLFKPAENVTDDSWLSKPAITEASVETKPAVTEEGSSTTYPPGVSPPEPVLIGSDPDRGVVEWLLGLVGIKPGTDSNSDTPSSGPAKGCSKCSCGLTYKHNRIVGGVETQVNEYPWMAYLTYSNRFYCGASLINNKYVLTAGHCVNGFTKDRLSVTFLDHDRSTSSDTKVFTRRVSKILRHRSYGTGGSYNNDIALLQLSEDVPLTGIIKPVCLPAIGYSYSGYTGIVTGWGATQSHGQVSNKLREVKVPILSNPDCKQTGYGNRITENMMCAGYSHGTKDSCQGDSGGPLHVVNGSNHFIVGIVSWGEGCAEPNYPGVYTRVNRYISWITSNTQDACYC